MLIFKKKNLNILYLLAFLLAGCSDIKLGNGPLNESAPSGNLVAQGSFSGLNGETVTGSASLYVTSNNTYTIRLESLSAPSENSLELIAISSGTNVYSTVLKSSSGSQNYITNVPQSTTIQSVVIYSVSAGLNYGQALFSYTN